MPARMPAVFTGRARAVEDLKGPRASWACPSAFGERHGHEARQAASVSVHGVNRDYPCNRSEQRSRRRTTYTDTAVYSANPHADGAVSVKLARRGDPAHERSRRQTLLQRTRGR
jgi:hypothetical protein